MKNEFLPSGGRSAELLVRASAHKERNTTLALVAAALVLAAAAFFLSRASDDRMTKTGGDEHSVAVPKKKASFPRDEFTLPRTATSVSPKVAERWARGDRLKNALRRPDSDGIMVVEWNALLNTPLIEKMMACQASESSKVFNELKDGLGLDVKNDIDRIGFDNGAVVVSGFFKDIKVPEEFGTGAAYGDSGRIFTQKDAEGAETFVTRVGDDILIIEDSLEHAKEAVDRVEGRGPTQTAPVEEGGEIYGVLGKSMFAGFAASDDPMQKKVAEVMQSARVRMNVDEAVSASIDATATDASQAKDLASALGAALSVARQQATAAGDNDMASLMEQARIEPKDDGTFAVDVAVTGSFLLKALGCDKDGKRIAPAAP
jgi:hypothetical protein